MRYPITFEPWYRWLSTVLGLPPSTAYVDIDGDDAGRVAKEIENDGGRAWPHTVEVDVTENGLLPQLDLSLVAGPTGSSDEAGA